MIQTLKTGTSKRIIIERAKEQLEALTNPDMDKLTDKELLNGLLPGGWKEEVFEYENRFYVRLTINKVISIKEEFAMVNLITRELGKENIILPNITTNTPATPETNMVASSTIILQLKKPNYEEELI